MEISLVHDLAYDSRLLKEIVVDVGSYRLSLRIEMNLEVLSEPRGIVVPQCLCVSERLEQWIGGQHHVLDLLDRGVGPTRDIRNVLHQSLCGFCLSCSRLSRNDYALVFLVCVHVIV